MGRCAVDDPILAIMGRCEKIKNRKEQLTDEEIRDSIDSKIKFEAFIPKDSVVYRPIFSRSFNLDEKKIQNCPCGSVGGTAEFKYTNPIILREKRLLSGIVKIENQKYVIKDTFEVIDIDTISQVDIELSPSPQEKNRQEFKNTIFLSNLSSGVYTLNFYLTNHLGKKDTIHIQPFMIQKGATNCPPKWIINEVSIVQEICLSTLQEEDSRLPCQSPIETIEFKPTDNFLIIGFDKEELKEIDLSTLLKFNANGHLIRKKYSKKNIDCKNCEEYENKTIKLNLEYRALDSISRIITVLDTVIIDPISLDTLPFNANQTDSTSLTPQVIPRKISKKFPIWPWKSPISTLYPKIMKTISFIDLGEAKNRRLSVELTNSINYPKAKIYYRTFQIQSIE